MPLQCLTPNLHNNMIHSTNYKNTSTTLKNQTKSETESLPFTTTMGLTHTTQHAQNSPHPQHDHLILPKTPQLYVPFSKQFQNWSLQTHNTLVPHILKHLHASAGIVVRVNLILTSHKPSADGWHGLSSLSHSQPNLPPPSHTAMTET